MEVPSAVIATRKHVAVLLAAFASAAAAFCLQMQSQSPTHSGEPALNYNLVLLDPAHGGPESGATLGDKVLEKDVTLALAAKLRGTLAAAGFTVISTRDADTADPLTSDQRAEIANRTHAVACIVLHATAGGSGVHVYTSNLPPPITESDADAPFAFLPVPWDAAQAGFVRRSIGLAGGITASLAGSHLAVHAGAAPIRPLDNLMCPAVAIELAPLSSSGGSPRPASDSGYQQQVADAMTSALRTWRDNMKAAEGAASAPAKPATPLAKAMALAQAVSHAAAQTPSSASQPAAARGKE